MFQWPDFAMIRVEVQGFFVNYLVLIIRREAIFSSFFLSVARFSSVLFQIRHDVPFCCT